jgi:hypothetical protein
MHVKGFDADGEVTAFRMTGQNESVAVLSARFSEALAASPSVETEDILEEILRELKDPLDSIRFQCEYEISRSKMRRSDFLGAIPHLVQLLKADEARADLWIHLATCARHAHNSTLYLIAVSRVRRIRPQLELALAAPALPPLMIAPMPPRFVGYSMVHPCWRLFVQALEKALQANPHAVPVFQFAEPPLTFYPPDREYDIERHPSMRFQSIPKTSKQRGAMRLGDRTLPDFFATLVAREFLPGTWTFGEPVSLLSATMLNKIATEFRFADPCPRDIAVGFIDIAARHLMPDLTSSARLVLAELASAFKVERCGAFLKDINAPSLYHPHALLRIAFALLEESIRNNIDYTVLEQQLLACRMHLDGRLFLGHAGVMINEELLGHKEQQIRILRMISTCSSTIGDAEELFGRTDDLKFLSLANVTMLFLQFDDAAAASVFPPFLQLLPEMVRKNASALDCLAPVFARITRPMPQNSVADLFSVYRAIGELGADPSLLFDAALASARASGDSRERAARLAQIHKQLGKLGVCHRHGGVFLECLLDALLPFVDEFESDVTAAFACYFSDLALVPTNHKSQLHFRCSRFAHSFYEHVVRIDDKNTAQNLFPAYFGIWKHWKSQCGCIAAIDGWRMYRHVKRRENQLSKRELPEGFQPPDVLEDLLRNDADARPESRIALAKVLIRSFVTALDPQPGKIGEALDLLSHGSVAEPRYLLVRAIAHALRGDPPDAALGILLALPRFPDVKAECRRLYWTIRMLDETGRRAGAGDLAREAIAMLARGLPAEFALPLVAMAAEIVRDTRVLNQLIATFCKTKPMSPYPYIALARLSNPEPAFKIIALLVRATTPNILNLFYFDFKPPFLMARPDDGARAKHDVLQLYVDTAAASGAYLKLFPLFNPSGKLDRKPSRALKTSRVIFGVDRIEIFEKYTVEFLKVVERRMEKGHLDANTTERALDALVRAGQLDTAESFRAALAALLRHTRRSMVGADAPPDATVADLLKQTAETEEEDDEEEDEDFVGSGSGDSDGPDKAAQKSAPTEYSSEATEASPQDEEEDATEQESG